MPITFFNPDTHNVVTVHTPYSTLIRQILTKKPCVAAEAHVPRAYVLYIQCVSIPSSMLVRTCAARTVSERGAIGAT